MARRLRPAKDTHRIVCGQRSVPGNRSTRIQSRHRLSKELLAGIVANPHPRKAAIQTLLAARRIDSPAKPSGFAAERISYLAQPGQRNTQQDRQARTASNLKPYVFTPDSGDSEFSTMIPIAGSAYTYSYATLGELVAWIIGWALVLEYAVGAATVSVSWAATFDSILQSFG